MAGKKSENMKNFLGNGNSLTDEDWRNADEATISGMKCMAYNILSQSEKYGRARLKQSKSGTRTVAKKLVPKKK